MALRLDTSPRQAESVLRVAKVFLIGFFIGETFLLLLLGAAKAYS
ncbi:MAG: hypothetical protein WDA75_03640 [Candidatus Latescibacterota bacterium]|jgi:hypothetical protein